MSVISTPGTTANSYASNAQFVTFMENDPWKKDDYPTGVADQDRALISATQLLDDVYGDKYKGTIYDTTYALYWPRTGVTDPRTGLDITTYTTFPYDLMRATALQAYHLFQNDRQQETADAVSLNKREKLDGVGEVERFDTSEQRSVLDRPAIHPEVSRIMAKWVDSASGKYSSVMDRG